MQSFKITKQESEGTIIVKTVKGDWGSALTALRSVAFDCANSGKYGSYPLDESFNEKVEQGFDDTGASWTSENDIVFRIEKTTDPKESFMCPGYNCKYAVVCNRYVRNHMEKNKPEMSSMNLCETPNNPYFKAKEFVGQF